MISSLELHYPKPSMSWNEFDWQDPETWPEEFVTVLVAVERIDEGQGSGVIEYDTDFLTTMEPGDWNVYGNRDYTVHAWCDFEEYTGKLELHHSRV